MRLGIDISKYQGDIDWSKTKKVVDFVIMRCGYGSNIVSQDDVKYKENAKNCTRNNIPFGVYLYSYATTLTTIQSEVDHTLRLIKNYKLEYPVYIDIEEPSQLALPKEELVSIVKYYCEKIEEAGYYVGIYASLSVLNGKLNSEELAKYDKWVAEWSKDYTYQGTAGMWQYTDNLLIPGVSGRVDGDKAFYNYPEIIRKNGLNHLETEENVPEEPEVSLKYKVKDKVYLNGNLYKDDEADEVIKEFKNEKTVIEEVITDRKVEAPYKVNLNGYVKEEDLSLKKKSKFNILDKIIEIIKKIFIK